RGGRLSARSLPRDPRLAGADRGAAGLCADGRPLVAGGICADAKPSRAEGRRLTPLACGTLIRRLGSRVGCKSNRSRRNKFPEGAAPAPPPLISARRASGLRMSNGDTFQLDTLALHAGQRPDPATGARAVP